MGFVLFIDIDQDRRQRLGRRPRPPWPLPQRRHCREHTFTPKPQTLAAYLATARRALLLRARRGRGDRRKYAGR